MTPRYPTHRSDCYLKCYTETIDTMSHLEIAAPWSVPRRDRSHACSPAAAFARCTVFSWGPVAHTALVHVRRGKAFAGADKTVGGCPVVHKIKEY